MIGTSCVVVRPAGRDSNGDPRPTTEHRVTLALSPVSSTEPETRGETVETVRHGFSVLADLDVLPGDQIRIAGKLWNVVGEPAQWVNGLTGKAAGVQVTLSRREG